MMKFIKFVLILNFSFIFCFVLTGTVKAQSCGGNYTSNSLYQCVQDITGLWSCPLSGTTSSSCGYSGALGGCYATTWVPEFCNLGPGRTSCATQNRIDGVTQSGCYNVVSPACTASGSCMPTGGCCSSGTNHADASCGSGLRCGPASGPGSTTPPNASCSSGDCFVGIANCGQVGRPNQTGTCSQGGVGGLCCAFGAAPVNCPNPIIDDGPGGCDVTIPGTFVGNAPGRCCSGLGLNSSGICVCTPACQVNFSPAPVTVEVGQTVTVNVNRPDYTGEEVGDIRLSGGPNTIINYSPGSIPCPAGSGGDCKALSGTMQITGLTPGAAAISGVSYLGWSQACYGGVAVNVTPLLASCQIDLVPNGPFNIIAGQTQSIFANVIRETNSVISSVSFSSSNAAVASVSPLVNITRSGSNSYSSQLTANSMGNNIIITATANMVGGVTCTDSTTVNVTQPVAWWQAVGGNVITNGGVTSSIPSSCTLPGCNPYLVLDGLSGRPGNVSYGGSTTLSSSNVSSRGWLTNSSYSGKTYNYDYFDSLIPNGINLNAVPAVTDLSSLTSGGIQSDGYYWNRKTSGTLNINSDIAIPGDTKIIVFSDSDVNIRGDITITNHGSGFFMIIARGDINIESGVDTVEGIFLSNQNININGDTKLTARGSIVAWGGVIMNRDLGAGNSVSPSESFEYDPPTVMLFPKSLIQDTLSWKEVQP